MEKVGNFLYCIIANKNIKVMIHIDSITSIEETSNGTSISYINGTITNSYLVTSTIDEIKQILE